MTLGRSGQGATPASTRGDARACFLAGHAAILADRRNIVRRPSLVIQPPWFVPRPCHPQLPVSCVPSCQETHVYRPRR
jgi:hypothetical protein